MSWLTDVLGSFTGVPKQLEQWGKDIGGDIKGIPTALRGGIPANDLQGTAVYNAFHTKAVAKPKGKGKGKGKPKVPKVTKAKQYEEEVQSSPMNQILQSVAHEYATAAAPAQAAASGSLTAPATQGAWAQALQSLAGASPVLGQTPSAWLGQNLATAAKTTAPLQAAMSAYGGAQAAAEGPILSNLTALGQGLGAEDVTAGASAWLNALASHVTSNLSYYGSLPAATVPSLPSSVLGALKASGGYPGGTSKGLVPLSDITTKGTTLKVKAPGAGVGSTLTGSVPSSLDRMAFCAAALMRSASSIRIKWRLYPAGG